MSQLRIEPEPTSELVGVDAQADGLELESWHLAGDFRELSARLQPLGFHRVGTIGDDHDADLSLGLELVPHIAAELETESERLVNREEQSGAPFGLEAFQLGHSRREHGRNLQVGFVVEGPQPEERSFRAARVADRAEELVGRKPRRIAVALHRPGAIHEEQTE